MRSLNKSCFDTFRLSHWKDQHSSRPFLTRVTRLQFDTLHLVDSDRFSDLRAGNEDDVCFFVLGNHTAVCLPHNLHTFTAFVHCCHHGL